MAKVMKDRKKLRVCPRLEEAEETQSPEPGGPWIGPWSGRKCAADSPVTLEQHL